MNNNKSGFFTALGVETIEILATIGAGKKEEGGTIIPPWIFKFRLTKFFLSDFDKSNKFYSFQVISNVKTVRKKNK